MAEVTKDDLLESLRMLESDEPTVMRLTVDEAVGWLRKELPGFWWRGGTCFLSSEAIIAPDHNCPVHGERLHREFPPTVAHWNEGVEVELRPGSDENLARALMAAICRVKLLELEGSGRNLADATPKDPSPSSFLGRERR